MSEQQEPVDTRPTRYWFRRIQYLWEEFLVPRAPFQRILECGVFEGESLLWACNHLLGEHGEAIGVDPYNGNIGVRPKTHDVLWPQRLQAAKEKTKARIAEFNAANPNKRCNLIEQESLTFLVNAVTRGWTFDFCYIDGNHFAPEALNDMTFSWQILKPGGVLVCDDLQLSMIGRRRRRNQPHSLEAWQAFKLCYLGRYEILYETNMQGALIKTG